MSLLFSTRPFLTLVEKKWIAYQILRGVADCHQQKVYHGDIKTENVLVTSGNWAYLVDFASYKPTFLPEVKQKRRTKALSLL
jgi:phosphoinositide-3-kinase regulatory subunit 4